MAFAALADLKNQLNIPSSDTSNDAELTLYLNASNEVCEQLIGKAADTTFTENYATVDGGIVLMQRPLISVTTVTPYTSGSQLGVVVPSTSYLVDLVRNGLQLNGLSGLFQVVYHAGWASIPTRATLACTIIGQHLWETQRGGMVPTVVASQDVAAIPGVGFAIPKRAAELLNSLSASTFLPGIA